MVELALRGVSKSYNGATVLDNIDIRFSEMRFTAVIGKSGSGKTTLLRLLNGLEKPDRGEVIFSGRALDYSRIVELRRKMGYAVQGTALFPHLSVRENICCLAKLEKWSGPRIAERIEVLLGLTHLPTKIQDRYPHELSGGQQQRVGLCRAMMLNPPVLLLDEPFAAIDPGVRADILQQLSELQRAEPRTTLLVTHDLKEALFLADDVLILKDGRVMCHEPKDELVRRHSNDLQKMTQAFFG